MGIWWRVYLNSPFTLLVIASYTYSVLSVIFLGLSCFWRSGFQQSGFRPSRGIIRLYCNCIFGALVLVLKPRPIFLIGKVIACPSGPVCDNFPNICHNGLYFTRCSILPVEYKGQVFWFTNKTEGGRQLFVSEFENCIWWLPSQRQWHLGPCDKLGTPASLAYLETGIEQ